MNAGTATTTRIKFINNEQIFRAEHITVPPFSCISLHSPLLRAPIVAGGSQTLQFLQQVLTDTLASIVANQSALKTESANMRNRNAKMRKQTQPKRRAVKNARSWRTSLFEMVLSDVIRHTPGKRPIRICLPWRTLQFSRVQEHNLKPVDWRFESKRTWQKHRAKACSRFSLQLARQISLVGPGQPNTGISDRTLFKPSKRNDRPPSCLRPSLSTKGQARVSPQAAL